MMNFLFKIAWLFDYRFYGYPVGYIIVTMRVGQFRRRQKG